MSAYDIVRIARSGSRPTGADYIRSIFSPFIELHGDRRFSDDAAIFAGIGMLGKQPVTAIAIDKGHDTEERTRRHFGAPEPEGYRKALRLMKEAEKFRRPIVTFVDTSGAYCGIDAEERGQGSAIAENLWEMMDLDTPILSILIGEGGSGGALALAAADRVWMLENSVYSVISPEGCASILWKDAGKAAEAAEGLKLTAEDAARFGIAEEIISEDGLGGKAFYNRLGERIGRELGALMDEKELLQKRYDRFRSFGRKYTEKR